jgi:hypothetical protein
LLAFNQEKRKTPIRRRRRKMKTLFSTLLIAVLAVGLLLAASPGKAEAWHRGPAVSFSFIAPPFGVSIGTPGPYYYYDPAPIYVAPPYPLYRRVYSPYYRPYYGYYYGYRNWDHRGWRGDWHSRDHDRGYRNWR